MFQNNWVAQQLVQERNRRLQEKSDHARQAQEAQKPNNLRSHRRIVNKLRSEMTTL